MRKPAIRPRRWIPPRDRGLVAAFSPNDRLKDLTVIPVPGTGPEDVAVSQDGWIYTGLVEGAIVRVRVEGGPVEHVADTGGRPLGIEIDPDGSLVVCDSLTGLLRVDPGTGRVTALVDEVAGKAPLFTNNAAIAADGSIYFTDSSTTASVTHFKAISLSTAAPGACSGWIRTAGWT